VAEFRFYTKLDQTILLGIRARNVEELLESVRSVPKASVYYHTHRFLQQHHYLSPEPPNDFAYWVTGVLGDDALGEQLSSIDAIQFDNIAELRNRFIEVLHGQLQSSKRRIDCPPGEEFHFMSLRTFVFPTSYAAHDGQEFREILGKITFNSLYYHIFDSKLRLEKGENDFSCWFRDQGEPALADQIKRLDPYTQTLDGLRKRIIELVRTYGSD
jgi:hypothetical protein